MSFFAELLTQLVPLYESFLSSAFAQRSSGVKTVFQKLMEQFDYKQKEEPPTLQQEKERISKSQEHLFSLVIQRFNMKNKVSVNHSEYV